MFEPVKNQRVSDEILQQIREAVLAGKFQVGDRLPNERTLAEQFVASRTSVREALRGLQQEGVIYTKKGVTGGAFVADLDHRLVSRSFQTLLKLRKISINHIAEARLIFEPQAARLAALRATSQDLKELEEVIETMKTAVEAGKSPGSFDLKFHKLVARAAGNPIPLKHMMARLGLLDTPEVRLPLVAIDLERGKILDEVLSRAGLLERVS